MITDKNYDALQEYLTNSSKINKDLRNGIESPKAQLLDEFFETRVIPAKILFRGIPDGIINYNQDRPFEFIDFGYMSTSTNFEETLDKFAIDTKSIILAIHIDGEISAMVSPQNVLSAYNGIYMNDEGEILLPRGTSLIIEEKREFKGGVDDSKIQQFLSQYDEDFYLCEKLDYINDIIILICGIK